MSLVIDIVPPDFADYQKKFLYGPERFSWTEAATKVGKTHTHLYWLFEQAHRSDIPKCGEVWWVAPVYSQTRIAFNRLRRWVEHVPGYVVLKSVSEMSITTPLGTIIRFKSGHDPNNLYGENVYAAVFDEFTRGKSEAWDALRSTLTHTRGKCKLIGNYQASTSNWARKKCDEAKAGKRNHAYHRVDAMQAVAAGILDADEIEQARIDLPKSIFDSLYMCKGSADDTTLFGIEAVSDLFSNSFVAKFDVPSSKRFITADIALYGSDRFVIGVWYGMTLREVIVVEKCTAPDVVAKIKGAMSRHSVPISNVAYDADGVGAFVGDYLPKGAKSFHGNAKPVDGENYANLRTQCYYELSKAVDERGMYVSVADCEEKIYEELVEIRRDDVTAAGRLRIISKEQIKAIIGRSPDFADMMMMRMFFNIGKTNKRQQKWM